MCVTLRSGVFVLLLSDCPFVFFGETEKGWQQAIVDTKVLKALHKFCAIIIFFDTKFIYFAHFFYTDVDYALCLLLCAHCFR